MRKTILTLGLLALVLTTGTMAAAHDPNSPEGREEQRRLNAAYEAPDRVAQAAAACTNGMAGSFPCRNVDLLSQLPLSSIGGGSMGNSMWAWVDPSNAKEYIIALRNNGASFVDVTNGASPVYLGTLPSHNGTSSSWRDARVYHNHLFVGADNISTHGIQVFDLTRLRGVTTPQTFTADARYSQLGRSHTLAINEETGFLYAVGSDTCNGGVHMIDVRNPKSPTNAGCVSNDGYTHENQCMIYRGPDTQHVGKEICFNYNGDVSGLAAGAQAMSPNDTLTIVDVTNKSAPVQLSRTPYNGSEFTHQGWLTADYRHLIMNDELDTDSPGTKTFIFDVSNLDAPTNTGVYTSSTIQSTDHNNYIMGNRVYQAAYRGGLRILDASNVASAQLTEVGYLDIYPSANNTGFNGAWQVHAFLPSGNIAIMGIEQGLIMAKPTLTAHPNFNVSSVAPTSGSVAAGSSISTTVTTETTAAPAQPVNMFVSGLPAGATATWSDASLTSGESATLTINTSASTPAGTYAINVSGAGSTQAVRSKVFTLTVTGTGGGTCSGTNANDVQIPDLATVESTITIAGCAGNASASSKVEVHIVHTYRGDLVVSLVAPDGTVYTLLNRSGGSADNVDQTFTVNLGSEVANGNWKLRVRDAASQDIGYINSWTLTLR